jgi:outer membrane autotransporter protein
VETDFSSSDIRNNITGEKAGYETDAIYYGAHIDLGYLWNITETLTLDVYTKYLWTRQEGDSVTMAGERYTFDDIDSHRWRTGGRFSYDAGLDNGAVFTPYIGAAFDYEFDSKAHGSVNGRDIDSPDIEGATGMGELGLAFKPSADSGLSLDLGIQGYTGKRKGVSGSFQVKFEF